MNVDAVILAAGKGERLKPLTNILPKPLLPIVDKPLIKILIENLINSGVKNIYIVISNKRELFEKYLKEYNIEYIIQKEPLGTADAIKCVKEYVSEPFLTLFGDCLYSENDIKGMIRKYKNSSVIGIKYVNDAYKYGVFINGDIVEKPKNIKEGYVLTGLNLFTDEIFNYIERVKKSPRGEYELTDALRMLLKNSKYEVYELKDYWNDIGTFTNYMDTCFYILENMKEEIFGKIEDNVKIKGKVILKEGAEILSNTYIEGIAYIGENSKIGPFSRLRGKVIIGRNCRIGSFVEIKNSIIYDNTNVPHLNYVGDSIIASNCNLGAGTKIANLRLDEKNIRMKIKGEKVDIGRRKFGCVIGFNTKIGINVSINPGKRIGNNCKIGPGVIVYDDVEDNTTIIVKQEYIVKK